MAVTVTNTAEGLIEAEVPSTGNTGGASGTDCSAVAIGTSSTIQALAAAAVFGNRGYRLSFAAAAGDGDTRLRWALTETGRVVIAAYVRLNSTITATEDLMGIRNGSGVMGQLMFGTDGKIRMWNAAGSGIAGSVSTGTIPTDGTPRLIQMAATKGTGTGDGKLEWAIFDLAGTLLESWSNAAVNAGTSNPVSLWLGRSTGRTGAHVIDYDQMSAGPFVTGWIDPVSGAPTANAGPDQTLVEPGRIIQLDATSSTVAYGSITDYTWTQTDGQDTPLSNPITATPTLITPATLAGTTLTYQVTVTGNALTDTDTISITVLPASLRLKTADSILPGIRRTLT